MLRSSFHRFSKSRSATVVVAMLALVAIAATGLRIHRNYSSPSRQFDWSNRGHSDFHNGVYFPSLAFRQGVNPYSPECAKEFPIARSAPTYSPMVFLIHLPFSYLEIGAADVGFYLFNVLMLALLSWIAIKFSCDDSDDHEAERSKFTWFGFWFVFLLVLISRPGHITLFTGYFTAEIVLGTVLAIHYARRKPAIAGLGLMLASLKPTFVLPLLLLLLCRKNFQAVFYGGVLSLLAVAIGLGWLVSHSSFPEVVAEIRSGQQALHEDVTESPLNTWTRTDIVGMAAKVLNAVPSDPVYLAMMGILLIIPGFAIYRIADVGPDGAASLSGAIISVSILLSVYHHSYDCLLLVVPWVGITFYGCSGQLVKWERNTVTLMMAVVAANYLSTRSAREILGMEQDEIGWQLITLLNGICLIIAAAILIHVAFRAATKSTNRS